uniref:Uncharacterized protein n=1 Tax=Picea glauca TaxID=3330 RepID=A0A101M547_PICGL|nr:hypothetical protein ABT39_MTgene965 [Picea glauca]QHR91148.1 hypothetical protein Q903MT_gene5180 [Picea sitchensis]
MNIECWLAHYPWNRWDLKTWTRKCIYSSASVEISLFMQSTFFPLCSLIIPFPLFLGPTRFYPYLYFH